MSAPKGRAKSRQAEEEDELVSMVGQRVWFVDQIEPVGTIRETIPGNGGRIIGFIIEDEKTRIVRRVQRGRVRKYGDRFFLVTAWFAKADQSAKELEAQLSRGLAPDRDMRYWQQFSQELGQETLKRHLGRIAPPTYAVAGQLAGTADQLSQDLARAAVTFRRVQRALVANQSVMSPEEYAQFIDEARKWARTVRLVLMALEFMGRALPHAQIDVRNPDAPLPSGPVYIPFESLLETHTPTGEGKARDTPPPPTVEAGHEAEYAQVFEADTDTGGEWQEAEDFEAAGGGFEEFHPIKPLKEYDEPAAEFEAVAEPAVPETFEAVAEIETFEVVEEPKAPAPAPKAPARGKPAAPGAPPAPAAKAVRSAEPAQAQALPEEEEETSFSSKRAPDKMPGQWLTPPAPPPPKPAQVRQAERYERSKDTPDLDAIIAASLGKTPKKSPSKASQGEISGADNTSGKNPNDALSRELASLLDKSRRKQP